LTKSNLSEILRVKYNFNYALISTYSQKLKLEFLNFDFNRMERQKRA